MPTTAPCQAGSSEGHDFLGAVRLPAEAFQQEGTRVVTDLLFLRKRAAGEAPRHADPAWLETAPLLLDGGSCPVNRYFLHHPAMVLGTWRWQGRLYAREGYTVTASGDLAAPLAAAIQHLPRGVFSAQPGVVPCAPQVPAPLPPLAPHLTEGSFFVADDGALVQIRHGAAVPVTHGSTPLHADGTLLGRRLAALITLRDAARHVLRSQHEARPEAQRQAARQALHAAYDRFVAAYGPVNTTTVTTTTAGTAVRRMPNLVRFREDPDAVLVMALEHYDDRTGVAEKAALFHHDVVGPRPPRTHVASAAEGLLVSLNERGVVDLPAIATLVGAPIPQILAELGDLVYRDPETQTWQTADVYLSGNVRAKLAAAEAAGPASARNAEALRAVQPEDVLPGDIDAKLGAPWVPASDVQAFAADLFGVSPDAVTVLHLAAEALWSLDADWRARASVAATADFGTERVNGLTLLEQALNLQRPTVYDVVERNGTEIRVLNPEATLAARDKQQQLQARFRAWLFADPARAERLVRIYNDTYNTLRLRHFDGSHLDFPGMNPAVTPYPHQRDAVWRIMSGGNTLLAHAVGAGKTLVMLAAGMKMRQAGLIRKPLYVVPNHLLEAFAREGLHLYPNARLLLASTDAMTRERRALLTAQLASGAWDGIVTTHSAFERLGMSRAFRARFLQDQIDAYEALLCEHAAADTGRAHRNLRKTLEKHKARHAERLQTLLAEDAKDAGLVFDELGIDYLCIDEAHYFKNVETPTKLERVAGIQTAGSARAMDLLMKIRYLHEQHPGRGVTFATGTPVSNTMVELYTLQRYLDPEGLASRGLAHFDAWAATFGEVVEAMELAPDGASLRPRSRFAKFVNLPELQQMFRHYADVLPAATLPLPRPRLAGGKATVVACPMSPAQRALQDGLVARYEAVRRGTVKPWEDNALAVTTDGRTLALEARLLSPTADDFPDSKVNALVANVAAIWRQTAASRGTQLVFADLGVHRTPWGYSVYDDLLTKLVRQGLPRQELAVIGDADTDAKKQALFTQVRQGAIRVLLGSTQKMGTGMNVQTRLVALHSLDCPWRPDQIEQREGRILRQGNTHAEVAIYRYVTQGSFDAYLWQTLETKATFIAQLLSGATTVRQAEDVGTPELSYAEVKAIASGHPALLTLAEATAAVRKLQLLRKHHADAQFLARRHLHALPDTIARLAQRIAALTQDLTTAEAYAGDPLTLGTQRVDRPAALAALGARLQALPAVVHTTQPVPLGVASGLAFGLVRHPHGAADVYVDGALRRTTPLAREGAGPRAILNAVDRLVAGAALERATAVRDLALAREQQRDYTARLDAPFPHEASLDELTVLRDQLEATLSQTAPAPGDEAHPPVEGLVARLKALHAAHTLEAAPERPSPHGPVPVAEAITTRIRQREAAAAVPQPDNPPLPAPTDSPHEALPASPAPPMPWRPPQQLRLF